MLVIFLFLRNLSATIIPSLALPFSIVGTFAIMWALNYSLDNLSLMALTLSVGFVVDDAIVMLENIVRHMEMGKPRMQAALDGSKEIAFTIISMTVSLAAVFIPILFMGGIVGRLMHEFAVTIGAVDPGVGPGLADADADAVQPLPQAAALDGARLLLQRDREDVRRLAEELRVDAEADDPLQGRDDGRLGAAAGRHGLPVRHRAQGLHSRASTPARSTAASSSRRASATTRRWRACARSCDILQNDPNVAAFTADSGGGRLNIDLKPRDERDGMTADMIIEELRPKLNRVPGVRVTLTNPPAIRIGGGPGGGRGGGGATRSRCRIPTPKSSIASRRSSRPALREIPGAAGRATRTCSCARRSSASISIASRSRQLGLTVDQVQSALSSAYSARQISQIYAPDDEYQVIMQVAQEFQQDPAALSMLYVQGSGGKLIPLSAVVTTRQTVGPQSINHIGQLPSVTLSFNLQPGVALGDALGARAGDGAPDAAGDGHGHAAGHGAGVRGIDARPRLDSRARDLRHLRRPRDPLRELHPPDHDSLGPAVGRLRRAADAADLQGRTSTSTPSSASSCSSAWSRRTAS